jgi:hypothetical protein
MDVSQGLERAGDLLVYERMRPIKGGDFRTKTEPQAKVAALESDFITQLKQPAVFSQITRSPVSAADRV